MDECLADLRYHWDGAYIIQHPAPDRWVAQRRDTGAALAAETPEGLREAIMADYTARPVPRIAKQGG